jgi:hypothetical protein
VTYYFRCSRGNGRDPFAGCTVTNACFTGTRVVAFRTAQHIMKAGVAGVSSEQMSMFKTRFFPVLVDQCGGVIEFIVNVGRRITFIC